MNNQIFEKDETNLNQESQQGGMPTVEKKKPGKKILIICIGAIVGLAVVFAAGYFIMMPSVDDVTGVWECETYSSYYGGSVTYTLAFDEGNSGMRIIFKNSNNSVLSTTVGDYEIDGYTINLYEDDPYFYHGTCMPFSYNPFTKTLTNGQNTYTRTMTTLSELFD